MHRLSRKFVFTPPPAILQAGDGAAVPAFYSVAHDLTKGARIVAEYGNNIVLYSVPIDALRFSRAEQENIAQDPEVSFDAISTVKLLKHPLSNAQAVRHLDRAAARYDELNMAWIHYLNIGQGSRPSSIDDIWPLNLAGIVIGSVDRVTALAVQDDPGVGVMVWAFGKCGIAKAWKIHDGMGPVMSMGNAVASSGVACDGTTDLVT